MSVNSAKSINANRFEGVASCYCHQKSEETACLGDEHSIEKGGVLAVGLINEPRRLPRS